MLLRIDPTSAVPLFEQLAASVRADASRGTLRAGDRLPAARDVAGSLDVNVHTVLRAYQALRDEGLVDLRRGRGAVVTDRVSNYSELGEAIPRLVATARQLGLGRIDAHGNDPTGVRLMNHANHSTRILVVALVVPLLVTLAALALTFGIASTLPSSVAVHWNACGHSRRLRFAVHVPHPHRGDLPAARRDLRRASPCWRAIARR